MEVNPKCQVIKIIKEKRKEARGSPRTKARVWPIRNPAQGDGGTPSAAPSQTLLYLISLLPRSLVFCLLLSLPSPLYSVPLSPFLLSSLTPPTTRLQPRRSPPPAPPEP